MVFSVIQFFFSFSVCLLFFVFVFVLRVYVNAKVYEKVSVRSAHA